MNSTQRFGLVGALVVLSAVLGLLAAPSLPEQVATHWNATAQPDGTMCKTGSLAIAPALSALLLTLFALLPRIDPLGDNIAEFRRYYDSFVVFLG